MGFKMKIALCAMLCGMVFQVVAKDVPRAFQGKWVGIANHTMTSKQVSEYCQFFFGENGQYEFDNGIGLVVGKNSLAYQYWESAETFKSLNYKIYTSNQIQGIGQFIEDSQGQEDISQRKFELALHNNVLTDKYLDYAADGSGKRVWYTRTFYRCK